MDIKTIGINITKARQNAGISKDKLAEDLEIGTFILGIYEDGYMEPTKEVLHKIATLCKVDVSEFGL